MGKIDTSQWGAGRRGRRQSSSRFFRAPNNNNGVYFAAIRRGDGPTMRCHVFVASETARSIVACHSCAECFASSAGGQSIPHSRSSGLNRKFPGAAAAPDVYCFLRASFAQVRANRNVQKCTSRVCASRTKNAITRFGATDLMSRRDDTLSRTDLGRMERKRERERVQRRDGIARIR